MSRVLPMREPRVWALALPLARAVGAAPPLTRLANIRASSTIGSSASPNDANGQTATTRDAKSAVAGQYAKLGYFVTALRASIQETRTSPQKFASSDQDRCQFA